MNNSLSTLTLGYYHCFFDLTDTGKRISTLVAHGCTNVLFHVLVAESREPNGSEELLMTTHQLLSKLGPKGIYIRFFSIVLFDTQSVILFIVVLLNVALLRCFHFSYILSILYSLSISILTQSKVNVQAEW